MVIITGSAADVTGVVVVHLVVVEEVVMVTTTTASVGGRVVIVVGSGGWPSSSMVVVTWMSWLLTMVAKHDIMVQVFVRFLRTITEGRTYMLERLITSKVRRKLLTEFLMNPSRAYYCRQLSRLTRQSVPTVHKELRALESAGLLRARRRANRRYYRVNTKFPGYRELQRLILNTEAVGDPFRARLKRLGNIQHAFIYGSFAAGNPTSRSDLDLMIVGNPDADELALLAEDLESSLGRDINYMVVKPKELQAGRGAKAAFLADVQNGPTVNLLEA